jgi:iron complex transport system permease protein
VKGLWLNPGLAAGLACALVAACLIGPTPMAAEALVRGLAGHGEAGVIIWQVRLPRALAAALVGAALGACGAALQGLLRNPLAEPGVLGVSATASLAATAAIFWGLANASPWILPIASILGALAATGLLAALAPRVGSAVTLILIGVGLSSVAGALMSLALNFAPNPFTLADLVNWSLGSVANRSVQDLALAAPFAVAGFALLALAAPGLRALTLGEEAAAGIGLDLGRTRAWVVIGCGLATGASVALAGAVGFVGIVAAHLVRQLVGHDPARTLIPAALAGAVLLTVADILIRLIPTGQELKLGVVVALIGAPAFVAIAARRRSPETVA